MSDPAPAAFGLRVHSGWAALVAVAGSASAPFLVDRRRIGLVEPGRLETTQPYHAAAELDLREAAAFVQVYAERARCMAIECLRGAIGGLKQEGYRAVGCGLLLSSGRPTGPLAQTLASHALIHTAEGYLFRNALAQAGECCGLPVTSVKERELFAAAEATLGIPASALGARLADMGRDAGPPWRQDQKYSALVGWLALVANDAGLRKAGPGRDGQKG
jgi:hypothetical protein